MLAIRHWQRTQVGEAEKTFTAGRRALRRMPRKRNPILTENLTGLGRLLRGYAGAVLETSASGMNGTSVARRSSVSSPGRHDRSRNHAASDDRASCVVCRTHRCHRSRTWSTSRHGLSRAVLAGPDTQGVAAIGLPLGTKGRPEGDERCGLPYEVAVDADICTPHLCRGVGETLRPSSSLAL